VPLTLIFQGATVSYYTRKHCFQLQVLSTASYPKVYFVAICHFARQIFFFTPADNAVFSSTFSVYFFTAFCHCDDDV